MELERIHRTLLVDISEDMVVASPEYHNFIEHMKKYVPKGLLDGQKTLLGKFDVMERRGYLKPGYYEKLKDVCTASGNSYILDMIQEAERRIKQIQQPQQSEAVLARKASEKDLACIAQSVGSNWEMLAPFLLKGNAMVKVDHIKEDNRTSVARIYHLLLTWSKQAAPDTTLGHLFHQMLQVGTSVTVEWRTIAEYLRIEEKDIRACRHGYQPPVQESSTDQPSNTVPDEVVYDPYKLQLYEEAILRGKERENTLRINIIGNYAQGKTSLANRLIGKTCEDVTTTNGIEINKYKCHTLDDGSHTFKSFENENHEFANRVAAVARSIEPTISLNTDETPQDQTQTTDAQSRLHSEDVANKLIEEEDLPENKEKKPMALSSEEMATFSNAVEVLKDKPAKLINIWDFGGQYIFYATHTLFHSNRALYLLVFDLTKSLDTVVLDEEFPGETGDRNMEYFARFWLESIHAYNGPDPQVILVGTHKDKLHGNYQLWEEYFENVRCLFDKTELIHHIQKEDFAVDNYDMSDPVIADLREFILRKHQALVQHIEIPALWIQLEKSLRALKTSIISFQDVVELDKNCDYPLHDEEQLKLFLHYHHEKGSLFFYDEDQLSDSICLDPRFLVDAFKCIISSDQFFKNDPDVRSLRITLSKEGRLSHQLIDKVWSNNPDFLKHKDVIIGFLKKQNIIAEVFEFNTRSEDEKQRDWFIVPSLLKDHSSKEEMMIFLVGKPQSKVRFAMKFDKTSIVHQVFHKALAAALGIWPVVNCGTKQLLFENMCVFKLTRNHTGLLELRKKKWDY